MQDPQPKQTQTYTEATAIPRVTMRVKLRLKPVPLRTANEYVRTFHRHHKQVRGCLFCVSVWDELDTRLQV